VPGKRFGILRCAAPTEKLGAVGFKFRRLGRRFDSDEVRSPDRAIVRSAETAPRNQSFAFRQPLSFDEEFVESRMRTISPVRRKRELEITGQLQSTGFA
jgi:hypothetical protein